MDKKTLKAAFNRAIRTFFQSLASSLPVGFIITPEMISKANWNYLMIVLAWIATALFAGVASLVTSFARGMPEIGVENDECNS
jgi:hypothetical protein